MNTEERLRIAYTLLPPPLAALPAKYWTSISLWLHSYSVGRTFEELVKLYEYTTGKELLTGDSDKEVFIIGFIHDMWQKLVIDSTELGKGTVKWIVSKLEELGVSKRTSRIYKTMITGMAETATDPAYPKEMNYFLRFADRLQGTNNISDIISHVIELNEKTGFNLNIEVYNIMSPHPLLKSTLYRAMYNTLSDAIRDGVVSVLLPISTPHGLLVLSDEPLGKIEFDWNEIREIDEGDALLPKAEAQLYERYIEYCRNRVGEKPSKWKSKNCHRLGELRLSTYETTLLYYGPRNYSEAINQEIVLPSSFKEQLVGIKINGVTYRDGDYICPFCGSRTPHGVHISAVADLLDNAAKEKWSRRYPPVNVKTLLNRRKYLACPLCLGEALRYNRLFAKTPGEKVFIALSLEAPVPLPVLEEVGTLLQHLIGVSKSGNSLISNRRFAHGILSLDLLKGIPENASTFSYDPFSATIYGVAGLTGKYIEVTVKGVALAGLLASWGLYPLQVSRVAPLAPTRKLLAFYKGQKAMFDFEPADKKVGRYTPYASLLMAAMGILFRRKFIDGESIPAVLEVLDYTPEHSPHLLQYASPFLYSWMEDLLSGFKGR